MPGGDRRGPEGFGPMTGRRMGYCVGNDRPGYMNQGYGFGRGYGRSYAYGRGGSYGKGFGYGRGFGFRHGYVDAYPDSVPNVSEKTVLENDIRVLKDQLSSLENRLSEIDKES